MRNMNALLGLHTNLARAGRASFTQLPRSCTHLPVVLYAAWSGVRKGTSCHCLRAKRMSRQALAPYRPLRLNVIASNVGRHPPSRLLGMARKGCTISAWKLSLTLLFIEWTVGPVRPFRAFDIWTRSVATAWWDRNWNVSAMVMSTARSCDGCVRTLSDKWDSATNTKPQVRCVLDTLYRRNNDILV